jgi:hypothetical protein
MQLRTSPLCWSPWFHKRTRHIALRRFLHPNVNQYWTDPALAYRRADCSACYLLHAGFLLGLSSTLKMEATCLFEMSIDFQRTTRRYITEDRTQLEDFVISGGQVHRQSVYRWRSVAVREIQSYCKWSLHFETFIAIMRDSDVCGFLLSLLFYLEDAGDIFLWNVRLTPNYTALQT